MHRLRAVEYQNSIEDTLGISEPAPVADDARPFEAIISDAAPWFHAAGRVARQLFDREPLPEPLACAAGNEVDRPCAVAAIAELGRRLFRRPLLEAEREAFLALYDASAASEGARGAVELTVRALLLSPAFLFHAELSDDPDGSAPERLDSYALAARLSFALWSTTPDPALLDAASVDLTSDEALDGAYQRLVGSERALALPDGWGEVWLGVSRLQQLPVAADVFPSFDEELRLAMLSEQRHLLRHYWLQSPPLRELPTLDLNFVDARLARHYGFEPGSEGFVSSPGDPRVGLLGQAALLTLTSFERRVSASHRGSFVVDKLLCGSVPAPPPGEAGSLGPDFPAGSSEREALARAVAGPSCGACHGLFDPVGLALSHFDAIGAYRTEDSQGQPIDALVQLPESFFPGAPAVNGLVALADELGSSPRVAACLSQRLASYLIHRDITDATDADLIAQLAEQVGDRGSLGELTQRIVMSDHFRFRRLAPTP